MSLTSRIAKAKETQQTSNQVEFTDLELIYLGAKPAKYYLKDANGQKTKTQGGWQLVFSEIGTSRIVKYIHKGSALSSNPPRLVDGGLYTASGMGYDFRSSMTVYIENGTSLQQIKE